MKTLDTVKKEMKSLGFDFGKEIHYQISPEAAQRETLARNQGREDENGTLCINTGKFTGRSPKDRFIVRDEVTEKEVAWGAGNKSISSEKFDALLKKVVDSMNPHDVYVRDVYACADERYKANIRAVCLYPWSSLFIDNMFINLSEQELINFSPEWHIICNPEFLANPSEDGVLSPNFTILNLSRKIVLIGGSGYTGEMKKGIFASLNFVLPVFKNTLPMHCSANLGTDDDTALFFGLSGTGKTTLSADPARRLIGDDEHGWTEDNVIFNFEGGCYAKVIDITYEKEPEIFAAIRKGALLENVGFFEGTKKVNYEFRLTTENTRVSYPLSHIEKAVFPSIGKNPKNVFFLTCDAFGVLPPISKLDPGQAAYHFISGYTAKIAGTEEGIVEPLPSFSTCFGAPFMPLHPTRYASMLSEKMKASGANVWLINTGWTGGSYGVGARIDLKSTRALIDAALRGQLDRVDYETHEFFGIQFPKECPGVSTSILNPSKSWENIEEYTKMAKRLVLKFHANFHEYEDEAGEELLLGAPPYKRSV